MIWYLILTLIIELFALMLGLTTATLFEMRSSHSNCIFDSFETIVAHLGYISGLKAERKNAIQLKLQQCCLFQKLKSLFFYSLKCVLLFQLVSLVKCMAKSVFKSHSIMQLHIPITYYLLYYISIFSSPWDNSTDPIKKGNVT